MSDSEQMGRLLKALEKLTSSLSATNKALNLLAKSNQAMADALYAQEGDPDEGDDPSVDMAGNPIRVS